MAMFRVTLKDLQYGGCEQLVWAEINCPSFVRMDSTDVSDATMYFDVLYDFLFEERDDAVMFSLVWFDAN